MNYNRDASHTPSSTDTTDMAQSLIQRLGDNANSPYKTGEIDEFSGVQEELDYEGYLKYLLLEGKDICDSINSENASNELTPKTNKEVLLKAFNENVIKHRFGFLHDLITQFLEKSGLKDKLYICEGKLDHVVIDYFASIYRLKNFHNISRVGRQTIYAYLAFWIVRRQPLQVLQQYATEEGCVFANEYFATSLLAYYCSTPAAYQCSISKLQEHVLYHLKYRLMDAHNLELLIASYEAG